MPKFKETLYYVDSGSKHLKPRLFCRKFQRQYRYTGIKHSPPGKSVYKIDIYKKNLVKSRPIYIR